MLRDEDGNVTGKGRAVDLSKLLPVISKARIAQLVLESLQYPIPGVIRQGPIVAEKSSLLGSIHIDGSHHVELGLFF